MQRDRELVTLSVDRDHASAVRARVGRGAIEVQGVTRAERPRDVGTNDADAIGGWIRGVLKDAGMLGAAKRQGVILSVPRGEVVLKRLELPGGTTPDELSEAVRFQMVRQLTISADDATIDYVPIAETPSDTQTILAAALSGDRLAWRRQILKAAGLTPRRIGLASTGIATALSSSESRTVPDDRLRARHHGVRDRRWAAAAVHACHGPRSDRQPRRAERGRSSCRGRSEADVDELSGHPRVGRHQRALRCWGPTRSRARSPSCAGRCSTCRAALSIFRTSSGSRLTRRRVNALRRRR